MNSKILEERLITFSVSVISICRNVEKSFTGQYLSNQLVRSAISPALNYGEAQSAESLRDFIHKLKIAVKELRESHVSLKILKYSELIDDSRLEIAISECNELISILVASIKSSQRRLNQS